MIDGGHTSFSSLSAPQLACGPTLSLPHTAVSVGYRRAVITSNDVIIQ
jgi:hypothetical protein